MADEPISAVDKPAPEYTEMVDAHAVPAEDKPTYGNDIDGIDGAAVELDEKRKAEAATAPRVREEEEPTPRKYFRTIDGRFTDQESPSTETLDLRRAANDLSRVRAEEQVAIDSHTDARVAEVTDAVRGIVAEEQQPSQPELTPEAQQQQQAQTEQAEFERALNNPRLRASLEAEVNKLEQSRAAYSAAATQAFELSAAATFAQFPELNGVTRQTLQPVLQAVAQNNPARAQAIVSALQGTQALHDQSQQAQRAQAEIAQARQAVWFKSENEKFDSWAAANESKETMDEVLREGRRVLKEAYGVTPEGLGQMLLENPGLRSAASQRMIYDSVKHRLALEKISAKRAPAPPVMRPGVSRDAPNYSDEVASALKAFNKSPDPKTAANFLNARRAAAKR
jgi:hypothetical protein